jgi:hypothetical protein
MCISTTFVTPGSYNQQEQQQEQVVRTPEAKADTDKGPPPHEEPRHLGKTLAPIEI